MCEQLKNLKPQQLWKKQTNKNNLILDSGIVSLRGYQEYPECL